MVHRRIHFRFRRGHSHGFDTHCFGRGRSWIGDINSSVGGSERSSERRLFCCGPLASNWAIEVSHRFATSDTPSWRRENGGGRKGQRMSARVYFPSGAWRGTQGTGLCIADDVSSRNDGNCRGVPCRPCVSVKTGAEFERLQLAPGCAVQTVEKTECREDRMSRESGSKGV